MIGHPELLDDAEARPAQRPLRAPRRVPVAGARVHDAAHAPRRCSRRPRCSASPPARCSTARRSPTFPQFVERGVFEPARRAASCSPGCRSGSRRVAPVHRSRPGAGTGRDTGARSTWSPPRWCTARPVANADRRRTTRLPLDGVRVVDCTAWWAGPAAPHALALPRRRRDQGRVDHPARPHALRATRAADASTSGGSGARCSTRANGGKRGITLDLTRPEGVALFERLVAHRRRGDRELHAAGDGAVRARLGARCTRSTPRSSWCACPRSASTGRGATTPGSPRRWRASPGMAWVTGFPDGPPVLVRGACDPLAGMHASSPRCSRCDERDRTGDGRAGRGH